jgi:hypothetical protein
MVVMPPPDPVTTPEVAPTDAMDPEKLLQEPPVVVSCSVIVAPVQTGVLPVMGPGDGFTVITCVATQVEPKE